MGQSLCDKMHRPTTIKFECLSYVIIAKIPIIRVCMHYHGGMLTQARDAIACQNICERAGRGTIFCPVAEIQRVLTAKGGLDWVFVSDRTQAFSPFCQLNGLIATIRQYGGIGSGKMCRSHSGPWVGQ